MDRQKNVYGSLTSPVSCVREWTYEEGYVVVFGRILNCERDLQSERTEVLNPVSKRAATLPSSRKQVDPVLT